MKEYLVKSSWHGYYSKGFQCIEIVSEETLNTLRSLIDDEFSFFVYEWEGKHSEKKVKLDQSDFTVVSDNPENITWFRKMFGEYVGNLHYSELILEKNYEASYEDDDLEEDE